MSEKQLWGIRGKRDKYPVCHPGMCWRRSSSRSNSVQVRMKDEGDEPCSDCPVEAKKGESS